MTTSMPIAKEKEIGEKYGALNTYKEKDESTEEEPSSVSKKSDESKIESSERSQFMDERKKIAGYPFSESIYKDNHGFVKGTRLLIPYGDSFLPPS